jgi:hypothetical protein
MSEQGVLLGGAANARIVGQQRESETDRAWPLIGRGSITRLDLGVTVQGDMVVPFLASGVPVGSSRTQPVYTAGKFHRIEFAGKASASP